MPETATTEMDAVMEVVTATKNAIARGIVTKNATAVTPEDAIGTSVAVNQQETHTEQNNSAKRQRGQEKSTPKKPSSWNTLLNKRGYGAGAARWSL